MLLPPSVGFKFSDSPQVPITIPIPSTLHAPHSPNMFFAGTAAMYLDKQYKNWPNHEYEKLVFEFDFILLVSFLEGVSDWIRPSFNIIFLYTYVVMSINS